MKLLHDGRVQMIPIDRIHVVNPRSRGKSKFDRIVANIASIGLKKPITVTPKASRPADSGALEYNLICGQGRLETYKLQGETEIPAVVVEASREESLLMSLAENLARRKRTSVEMARELVVLHAKGYKIADIARKVGLDPVYVRGLLRLMECDEGRLVTAVENSALPLSVAVELASTDNASLQRVLADLYESKQLRGAALITARRLIENRLVKPVRGGKPAPQPLRNEQITTNQLIRAFKEDAERQQAVIERARVCETRLRFIVSAMKKLLDDEGVVNLLKAEQLSKMPQYLADQISGKAGKHGA